jgi:hypothetical protein
MLAVRVVQVSIDQVVDVIAVGHRLMAAVRAMVVVSGVLATIVVRSALRRVGGGHLQMVLFDALRPHVVQMAIVQVIDVALVADGRVATAGTVLVSMPGVMRRRAAHGSSSFRVYVVNGS